VSFDSQCRLLFDVGLQVVLGTQFRLIAAPNEYTIDPEDRTSLAPVLQLLFAELQTASVDDRGELSLEFTGGVRLVAPPNEQYEAWELVHPDGRMAIAVPGGEIAIFPPRTTG
jgi:hypothetical protein